MVIKSGQSFMWLPNPRASWKIEVGGTDMKNDIISAEFTKSSTDEIGSFKLTLENSNEYFSDRIVGGEAVKFYCDYGGANVLVFWGIVEKFKNIYSETGSQMQLSGGHRSYGLLDITVSASYADTEASAILLDLISKYLTDYTTANIIATNPTKNVTINWNDKPFWTCVQELCNASDTECYVDDSLDFHFFSDTGNNNDDEALVWSDNLISMEGLEDDTAEVKNKIIVYGKDPQGGIIIATAQDTNSTLNTKEMVIKDEQVTSYDQAVIRAQYELSKLQDIMTTGTVTACPLMASLKPGDRIWIESKPHGYHGQTLIKKFTHKIPDETTTCIVQREGGFSKILRDRLRKEIQLEEIDNINKMTDTYHFPFDDNTNQFDISNLTMADSVLKLSSGNTGYWISAVKTYSVVQNYIECRIIGKDIGNSTFEYSIDYGNTWVTIGKLRTMQGLISPSTILQIKITLTSDTLNPAPEIDTLSLLSK